jgi:hypothetical protein
MKKQLLKAITLFLTTIMFTVSCSKDEDLTKAEINGGEIYRYQAAVVSLGNIALSEEEYQGMLGDEKVLLRKTSDNTLAFAVSSDAALGKMDLVIESLGNLVIHYEILDTKLTDSYENTLVDFFANMNSYSQSLSESPDDLSTKNTFESFKSVYQNANEEDKIKMALKYKANKALFDSVFLNNGNPTGKFVSSDDSSLIGLFVNLSNKVGVLQVLVEKANLADLIDLQTFLAAKNSFTEVFGELRAKGLITTGI